MRSRKFIFIFGILFCVCLTLSACQSKESKVVAKYKGQEILMSSVQYVRKLNLAGDNQTEQGNLTDLDIVNQIIQDMILVEEAEMRGCAATQEEIDELVESVKFAYEVPEGKELVDAFCKDAGISVDDYFDLIKTQAPSALARQKLRDAIGEEWCAENGVEFTKVNPPEGMIAAENAFISDLFEAHKSDIEYYIE